MFTSTSCSSMEHQDEDGTKKNNFCRRKRVLSQDVFFGMIAPTRVQILAKIVTRLYRAIFQLTNQVGERDRFYQMFSLKTKHLGTRFPSPFRGSGSYQPV